MCSVVKNSSYLLIVLTKQDCVKITIIVIAIAPNETEPETKLLSLATAFSDFASLDAGGTARLFVLTILSSAHFQATTKTNF
jgi:hypothetical protein